MPRSPTPALRLTHEHAALAGLVVPLAPVDTQLHLPLCPHGVDEHTPALCQLYVWAGECSPRSVLGRVS